MTLQRRKQTGTETLRLEPQKRLVPEPQNPARGLAACSYSSSMVERMYFVLKFASSGSAA